MQKRTALRETFRGAIFVAKNFWINQLVLQAFNTKSYTSKRFYLFGYLAGGVIISFLLNLLEVGYWINLDWVVGGAVENRTPVRKRVANGVYMLRKVVSFNLDVTQLAKLDQTSLKDSFYAETDVKYI